MIAEEFFALHDDSRNIIMGSSATIKPFRITFWQIISVCLVFFWFFFRHFIQFVKRKYYVWFSTTTRDKRAQRQQLLLLRKIIFTSRFTHFSRPWILSRRNNKNTRIRRPDATHTLIFGDQTPLRISRFSRRSCDTCEN